MGAHLIEGEFQSDKYPTTPRGKVPLSVKDATAQDLLWEYAQRRRVVDAEFSDDLEAALRAVGYARQLEQEDRMVWTQEEAVAWVRSHQADDDEHVAAQLLELVRSHDAESRRIALVLATDVDDLMGALRDVASIEYTRDEVRDQAKRALDRLRVRGVGDNEPDLCGALCGPTARDHCRYLSGHEGPHR